MTETTAKRCYRRGVRFPGSAAVGTIYRRSNEIWAYRNLTYNLAQRELKVRYKKSLLGWLWSLINPLSMLYIYTVVFGVFLKGDPPAMGNENVRFFASPKVYGLYLFSGLYVWNYFSGTVQGAIDSLKNSGHLMNKVYFPPECPVIATTATVALQAFIEGGLLAIIMILIGNVGWTFLLFPVILVFTGMFAVGIGMALSVYNVYYRDVGYLVGIGMNLLFYATPIIYPISLVPTEAWGLPLQKIMSFNPVYRFVLISRDAFYTLQWPTLWTLITVVIGSLLVFFAGWKLFLRKARNITEEL